MRRTLVGLLVASAVVVAAVGVAAAREHLAFATLVDVVRASTERFHDPERAIAEGWGSAGSCVSGPQEGAMGIHYVNGALVGDGALDAERPEALIYEMKNRTLRLVGVEYIVIAEAWHAANAAPPVLMGQHFHYVGSPNRYGLPAFYELHVWAWRENPNGMFVDWNPKVSCADVEGEAHH